MGLKIPDRLVYAIYFSDTEERQQYDDLNALWSLAENGAIAAHWDVIVDDWWWE